MTRFPVTMLFVGAAALTLPGCTVIGAAVGSAIPKNERVGPPYDASLKEGTPVHLTPGPEAADPEPVDGTYVGTHDSRLTLKTATGERTIQEGDVAELKKLGSHWFEGLMIGALVDLTLASVVAVELAIPHGKAVPASP
jgi:hypothetical protein